MSFKNIKIRVGMDELLSELGEAVGSKSDQETLILPLLNWLRVLGLYDFQVC